MKKILLVLLSLVFVLSACSPSEKPDIPQGYLPEEEPKPDPKPDPDDPIIPDGDQPVPVDCPHYILAYYLLENFSVDYDNYRACFVIRPEGNKSVYYRSTGADLAEYEALCKKYGDTTYDKIREISMIDLGIYSFLASDIVSIDLKADKAWGDRPAGASWKDLCWLKTGSPREYIESGYMKLYDWQETPPYFNEQDRSWVMQCPEWAPVSKPLSECTAADLSLMTMYNYCCEIHLIEGPYPFQSYNFTMTITTDDGKVYEVPVRYR